MRAELLTLFIAGVLAGCAPEGPTAFVDSNLPLDDMCEVQIAGSDGTLAVLSSGLYDIAASDPTAEAGTDYCARDYWTRLRVNSFLRMNSDRDLGRAEPNILQIHGAEVTLRSQDGRVLQFQDATTPLPNPFRLITGLSLYPSEDEDPSLGSIGIKTIPAVYADFLGDFIDQTIVADIQLFGTTTGNVDVDFKVFSFPVEICEGCLTRCASLFSSATATITREDANEGFCDDDSGQDGRVCYDINCL